MANYTQKQLYNSKHFKLHRNVLTRVVTEKAWIESLSEIRHGFVYSHRIVIRHCQAIDNDYLHPDFLDDWLDVHNTDKTSEIIEVSATVELGYVNPDDCEPGDWVSYMGMMSVNDYHINDIVQMPALSTVQLDTWVGAIADLRIYKRISPYWWRREK